MARQRGAAPAGQQAEPVGQPVEDLLHGEDPGPDRGQLDRQRQAVEPAAQVDDRRLVGGGQLERARGRRRPLGEQHDRLVPAAARASGSAGSGRGQLQGRHRDHVLPRHRQRLPAGGDHPHARRGPQQVGHRPARRRRAGARSCPRPAAAPCPAGRTAAGPAARRRPGPAGPAPPGRRCSTRPGSLTSASSTSQPPSRNPRPRSAAIRIASLVLPTPPGPTRLTSRASVSFFLTSASSRRRPTKLVASAGRLPERRAGLAMT